MHKLDNNVLMTPGLLRRLHAEAEYADGNGAYYAILCDMVGQLIEHQVGPTPMPEQIMFGRDIVPALNNHLHHDGAWMIVFTNPEHSPLVIPMTGVVFRRFVILWMDKDGDVQFPVENDEPFHEVLSVGPTIWLQQADVAWTLWHHAMRTVLDPQPREMFKRAQGEQAPVKRH